MPPKSKGSLSALTGGAPLPPSPRLPPVNELPAFASSTPVEHQPLGEVLKRVDSLKMDAVQLKRQSSVEGALEKMREARALENDLAAKGDLTCIDANVNRAIAKIERLSSWERIDAVEKTTLGPVTGAPLQLISAHSTYAHQKPCLPPACSSFPSPDRVCVPRVCLGGPQGQRAARRVRTDANRARRGR